MDNKWTDLYTKINEDRKIIGKVNPVTKEITLDSEVYLKYYHSEILYYMDNHKLVVLR